MRLRISLLASVAALGLGLVGGAARADEPAQPPSAPNVIIIETPPAATPQQVVIYQNPPKPERPSEHEEWYGGQTLLLDGAATAMFLGAGLTARSGSNVSGALALGGVGTFLLGAPIVHFAHGRIGPGFGSFALRVALPLEVAFDGLLLGAAMTPRNSNEDIPAAPVYGALIGLGLGAVGASVIDAALLARYQTSEVDPEAYDPKVDGAADGTKKESRAKPFKIEWAPSAAPVVGGATLGVAGVF